MEIDRRPFKKLFPNLYREIVEKKMTAQIDGVRTSIEEGEAVAEKSRLEPSMPTPIDYLRRCEDDREALEVIDYLEKRNEITVEEATKLRNQVKEYGVRSFGSKKEWGYYSKKYLGDIDV
ncbi:MAG: DUF2095 domain-containing protein [Aigarchaeota archaeon]|nr:DUF2095 domain-containing protein [Aigarchaeota archaeon]MCX8192507.1 DUF2095 domain-containing protein [Nitrososphaeria archaeon]MDW7985757.1 DUF2095 family protein [Nitrososphaerota archaeon]